MVMTIKSVLVVDGVHSSCEEILKKHEIKVTAFKKITKDVLLKEIANYDALVVRSATVVTEEVLNAGANLKLVCRAGAGVDNINIEAAAERKIRVINAPGANAISACELTCGLLMALARHVVPAALSMKQKRWDRALFTGTELNGKTLAVIGMGRVGQQVANRMHHFGMKVVGYDPYMWEEQCAEFHAQKMELDEIWPIADYITLHTPLNFATRNMINSKVLNSCKKGVKIVNVGRGGLIDGRALLASLQSGQVSGAAIDVFEEEPPEDEVTLEIIKHPAVVATPHLGASTSEAQVRVGHEIAEQIINLIKPETYDTKIAEVIPVPDELCG